MGLPIQLKLQKGQFVNYMLLQWEKMQFTVLILMKMLRSKEPFIFQEESNFNLDLKIYRRLDHLDFIKRKPISIEMGFLFISNYLKKSNYLYNLSQNYLFNYLSLQFFVNHGYNFGFTMTQFFS